ncbi:helix-turn-helix transcriptional regulator [Chitinophaga varians]|uniref:Helix-turn-helix transcriptional regulator n=1 Tax=Chitinophaga varians TaxID=2202339 RepID=A0A847RYX0_9BACT|nr:helix-turn-helix domain-containing protein [Chitinophaga varians]NLR66285.1 helix-turn-helix transcriptional regulator [Chitinophaga varians]
MIKETSSNASNRKFLRSVCRITGALEILSGRWKALVLIHISEGKNRFSLLKQVLPPVSDQVLGRQLRELEAEGLITKAIIAEVPVRVDYSLTDKGAAVLPILDELAEWYDKRGD